MTSQQQQGAPQSYFGNTVYSPQFGTQPQYSGTQYQQQALNQYGQRTYNPTDPNAGLARQFSNQNLGNGRQQSPFGRQVPPGQQRLTDSPGSSQQSYSPAASLASQDTLVEGEEPPEQDSSKYSGNVVKRMVGLHVLVQAFFKDSITRARERNTR